jgi:hypothetical protein
VLQVELRDPQGRPAEGLAANVPVGEAGTTWLLPLAVDDATGRWTVRVTDRLSGGAAEATVTVTP